MSKERIIKKEIWAVTHERIERFFSEQAGVTASPDGYVSGNCVITAERLEDRLLGSLSFPQTSVTFEGERDDVEKIYERFYMNFMSAGG